MEHDIQSFKELSKNYKVIFFDSFGVLKNADGIINGARQTFENLIQSGIDYFILTNDASRSLEHLSQNFKEIGFDKDIPSEKIISSGMMAYEFLKQKINSGRVVYVGTEQSATYIKSLGLEAVSIEDINFEEAYLNTIKALVFLDDEGFEWRTGINNCVNLLRKINIPVIVANTDTIYPTNNNNISVAIGGIADFVESILGRHFIKFGKPDIQIFNYAFEHINKGKQIYEKSDILMVGDTLTTDIIGANKFGIDTALVLSGNTIKSKAETVIKSLGIAPDYICNSIRS
ncbi:HAD-IIA family hydrolase [Aquimarina agarivorans]|uniref:HAD-IIA family hydrolase n=1 Tax=Aquimarina agarivorans TaxID=980584 RepID=UPI000248EBF1|nr:HAD-IIA family hydrolase [Aquimarina agarivorans]